MLKASRKLSFFLPFEAFYLLDFHSCFFFVSHFHSPFSLQHRSISFYYEFSKEQDYICSKPEDSGMHKCGDLQPYRIGPLVCNGEYCRIVKCVLLASALEHCDISRARQIVLNLKARWITSEKLKKSLSTYTSSHREQRIHRTMVSQQDGVK